LLFFLMLFIVKYAGKLKIFFLLKFKTKEIIKERLI